MSRSSIESLDLYDKQSIVNLLMDVQVGNVSCRRAATEIEKQLTKPHLTKANKKKVRKMVANGYKISKVASLYNIHPSTVWRICKSKQ